MTTRAAFVAVALVAAGSGACSRAKPAPPAPPAQAPPAPEWQILASELPQALLSVAARAPDDVYAVGADKGAGPLVLHFDGSKWEELSTGSRGDLWWVTVLPGGTMLLSGANATVLRYDGSHGERFERMKTPGLAKQTVYGVWGTSKDDFYAVGSASGRSGFVWHFHGGAFENERIPLDVPRAADGDVPGFFKAFGQGDDVWVVGAAGALLHRTGKAPFVVVPTPTKDTLFTVHGNEGRIVAVGGSGNGVIVQSGAPMALASPPGAGLLQGIFTSPKGDWATGERGIVYHRDDSTKAFAAVDHGLVLPAASSLHAVFVDGKGGVWSVGGNVLTPALDGGMLIHYGAYVPPVVIDDEPEADADAGAPAE